MVVKVLFAHQPVLTDGQALVRCENNYGVGRLAARFERVEDAANLRVKMRDEGVILLEMDADYFRCARIRRENFIATVEAGLDGKRMLRQKIGRNLKFLRRIQIQKFSRRLPRVMRRIKGDVHEERIRAVRRVGSQIINRRIGDARCCERSVRPRRANALPCGSSGVQGLPGAGR